MEDKNHKTKQSSNVIDFKTGELQDGADGDSTFGIYKPNEELLQSTARIKKQRDVIRERMDKMEQANKRVSQNVFEKVRRDYGLQLQTITELLNEKKDELKKEIKELYMRREKLTIEVNRHKEILEEAEFRLFLGEFSQNQFQEVENFETKEIEKLETDLSQISQCIHTHEELFDPEDLGIIAPQKKEESTKTVEKPVEKPVEQAAPSAPEPTATKAPQEPELSKSIHPEPEQKRVTHTEDISIDPSEFEDLFLDDESVSQPTEPKLKTEEEVTTGAHTADEKSPKDADYFNQEKVSEASFTVKSDEAKEFIDSVQTESKVQKDEVLDDKTIDKDIRTEVNLKSDPLDSIEEDSISDILKTLPTEDEPKADEKEIPIEDSNIEPGALFHLKLIDGEHEQKDFPLKENIAIGRSPSSDIVLKAPKVSRQHAAINMYNNQYIIIDLKSSNGVYVNGTKIDECVLNPGDEISIGGYRFSFTDKVD